MRPIDADVLLDFLDVGHLRPPTEICFSELMMKNIIDIQPTIDAVPVRHGKWKKSGNWGRVYKCDQCGNYLDFDGVNVGRGSANYCPNCGARMDEE